MTELMAGSRVIVALSGGKASAYCAKWALDNYPKEAVVFYFNDTKWEHPDLYRFMGDLSRHFDHPITDDSDGRSPEQLFRDNRALASNMMPFCSRILKAERLQKFYKNGDCLVFGIGMEERHRAERIVGVYQKVAAKTKRDLRVKFPLITEGVSGRDVDRWLGSAGIKQPALYDLGFGHNNCSGGCVRAGKKAWALLLDKLPSVYAERERVEEEVRSWLCKDVSYLKQCTLKVLREQIQSQMVLDFGDDPVETECLGICHFDASGVDAEQGM